MILLFEGDWPGADIEATKINADWKGRDTSVRRVKLHERNAQGLFDLFTVGSLPSLVVLSAERGPQKAYTVKALRTNHMRSEADVSSSLRDIPVRY